MILVKDLKHDTTETRIVRAHDCVGVLSEGSSEPVDSYLFESRILLPTFSFEFYNIQNGDVIVPLHISLQYSIKKKRSRNSNPCSPRLLNSLIKSFPTPPVDYKARKKIESMRLKDILYQRIEGCSWGERRIENKFIQLIVDKEKDKATSETSMIINDSSTPSADALPVFWS